MNHFFVLYSYLRRIRLPGHVVRVGGMRGAYGGIGGEPVGKRSLGIPRHIWEDGIKINIHEMGLRSHGLDLSGS